MRQYTFFEKFSHSGSLREKCPNMEFFLVRVFLYSHRKNLDTFHAVDLFNLDCVIHFHIPKKWLTSPVFIIKVLAVNIFGCYWADA